MAYLGGPYGYGWTPIQSLSKTRCSTPHDCWSLIGECSWRRLVASVASSFENKFDRILQADHTAEILKKAITDAEQQKTLMRELLHRDKNDFQMVMALLVMQEMKQDDPGVRQAFKHVMDRVSAISMAHDQLSMRPNLGTIDVADYLGALCGNLDQRREGIQVRAECEHAELVHERAVPLGLMVNELVTNAIKHAFPGGQGSVTVTFTVMRETEHGCVIVVDDGVGMGPPRPGSSGLRLVNSLAGQVGASVEQSSPGQGTVFRISFPLVL